MPDEPKAFTDAQRELFQAVAKLSRLKADDFAEADQWMDTKPPTAVEEKQRYRQQIRREAAERRQRKDRSWMLDVSGKMAARWRRWAPLDEAQQQEKAKVLAQWRSDRARTIRYALEGFAEKICEEEQHGPLKPHELIDLAASKFVRTIDDPLVFDAMNPRLKSLWARRLLRVVWVLTDTADLTTTKLDWLRGWKWGEHHLEFLGGWPNGGMRPIPRLWCRVTTLDPHLGTWERLTRHAIQALEEAEPGATELTAALEATTIGDTAHASRAATIAGQQFALAVEKAGKLMADDEAYVFVREHVTESPDDLPERDTWKRHLRYYRKAKGEQKNRPRHGRAAKARSIVPADGVERKRNQSG